MERRYKGVIIYILIGGLAVLLFLLPSKEENKIEVDAEIFSTTEKGIEWGPGLILPDGAYNIGLIIDNNDSGIINEVEFWTDDEGVLEHGKISAGDYSTWFKLTLENPSNILHVRLVGSPKGTITLRGLVAESESGKIYQDSIFFVIIFILVYVMFGVWYFSGKEISNQTYGCMAVMGAVVVASYFLFKPYLTVGHDIRFHLYRIESIKDGLLAGQFPVRLHPTFNNGYGYATAAVYPELFLYIPAVLRIFGVSIPTAYQSFLFLINACTAWIMYYSVRSVTKSDFASYVVAVAYVLFPYRLVCLYERAAIAEALGLCFIPLVIAGIYHVFLGDPKKWYLIVLGAVFVFQSHMLSTVLTAMVGIALGVIYLPRIFREKRWLSLLKAIGATMLFSMWYLVPFLDFYRMTLRVKSVETYSFAENAVFLPQLFNVFAQSTGMSYDLKFGMRGEMTMTLGVVVSLFLIVELVFFLSRRKEKKDFSFTLCAMGLCMVFCTTTWFPWRQVEDLWLVRKVVSMLQFPWRLLGYAGVLFLFSGGWILAEKETYWKKAGKCVLLCAILFLGAWGAVQYNTTMTVGEIFVAKGEAPDPVGSSGSHQEYLLEGTDTQRLVPDQYVLSHPEVEVLRTHKFATSLDVSYKNGAENAWMEVPLLWYPGYRAVDENGRELTLSCGDGNILRVLLPDRHEGEVHITFAERKLYWIGDAVTIFSLLGLIAFQGKKYVYYRRKGQSGR